MSFVELSCPSCGAPVDMGDGRGQRCPFCDAPLVFEANAEFDSHTEHVVIVEGFGPSNRERLIALLVAELDLDAASVSAALDALPAELGRFKRPGPAAELRRKIEDAGAAATTGSRVIKTPRLPDRDVVLDSAGPAVIAVIKVVREALVLGLRDAKDLVESAPCTLARQLDGARADALARALRDAGARVRLV